jgi:hypothetical protein
MSIFSCSCITRTHHHHARDTTRLCVHTCSVVPRPMCSDERKCCKPYLLHLLNKLWTESSIGEKIHELLLRVRSCHLGSSEDNPRAQMEAGGSHACSCFCFPRSVRAPLSRLPPETASLRTKIARRALPLCVTGRRASQPARRRQRPQAPACAPLHEERRSGRAGKRKPNRTKILLS